MANDGAWTGEGDELKASVGEQLREKARVEDEAEREKGAAAERESAIERHKEAERAEVARHGVDAASWRDARRAARQARVRRGTSLKTLAAVALGVAVLTRLFARRRSA